MVHSEVRPIKTLSLFSGAGGLDIGFHQAGFDVVGAVEIEPTYAVTLEANGRADGYFGHDIRVHCEDIREFDPSPYVGVGVELVIGGPPCQTFSAAGRRSGGVLGMDDERGQLFRAYIRVLDAVQPLAFVFENVYGLPGANGGGPWQEIVDGFEDAGYSLQYEVLDAADFGAPQHRERVIMVGFKGRNNFRFPRPTHGPDSDSGLPLTSAHEALESLEQLDEPFHAGPGGLYGHLLPLIPPGLNYSYFTREMGHPSPQFAWRSKFHDFLYKASSDEPVRTIKSKPGKFTGPFHWKNRHFTADELKRLQSFPDDYVVVGSRNKVLEQIGNSVPPALAHAIAVAARNQLFDDDSAGAISLRDDEFKSTFRKRQRERNAKFHAIAKAAIAVSGVSESPTFEARSDYFALFESPLDRQFADVPMEQSAAALQLAIKTSRHGAALDLTMSPLVQDLRHGRVEIDISGLSKYMDSLDVVSVRATLPRIEDLASLWVVIEHELVKRSRFFTLIDIYGHYANRGDTVKIETRIEGFNVGVVQDLVRLFAATESCGVALPLEDLPVSGSEVWESLDEMRAMRWDVRTRSTHATLPAGVVLCTYPFPSISTRAQFDRGTASLRTA